MSNSRDGYSSVPSQSDRYGLRTRSSGWRVPAFSSRNSWSRSDSVREGFSFDHIANRRSHDDPQSAYSGTTISSFLDSVQQPSHTPHQIPLHISNNHRRQHLEELRQAVHNQPARRESNSSSTSKAATEEEEDNDVLKHLTKETYNPAPKSLLLRNLSSYYRNKTPGGGNNSRNANEEGEKSCTVCLEDFEPRETVMITPCKHMFHKECIVPWLKTNGQCPLCRFFILKKKPKSSSSSPATTSSNLPGDTTTTTTMNDLFALELISVVRAIEESFLFGYPHRL